MKMKLFTSIAAVGLVAAMGTSAMAATLTETTNGATASVAALPESSGQMTVLVAQIDESCVAIDETTGAATVTNPTIDDNTIIYIDQQAYASGIFQEMGLKTTLTAGSYYLVRVGGENMEAIYEEVYKVVEEGGSDPVLVKIADVTGDEDGTVDVSDMNAMIAYIQNNFTHPTYAIGTAIGDTETKLGDVTGEGDVDVSDMNAFIAYIQNNFTHPSVNFDATVEVAE